MLQKILRLRAKKVRKKEKIYSCFIIALIYEDRIFSLIDSAFGKVPKKFYNNNKDKKKEINVTLTEMLNN